MTKVLHTLCEYVYVCATSRPPVCRLYTVLKVVTILMSHIFRILKFCNIHKYCRYYYIYQYTLHSIQIMAGMIN